MERREDVSCERRGTEIRRLQEQLKAYQRPPRPKCEQRRAEGRAKQGKGVSTHRAQRQRWKGVAIHSACVVHHVTVLRKARGRRYGVTSNGRKFHGLRRLHWGRARLRSRERQEDKADYLRTGDQEQYFKAWIKPVLTANPQPQPAWPPKTSWEEEQSDYRPDRVGRRTDGIRERYIEALEGGIKKSHASTRSPQESQGDEIAVQTVLAEKKCRRLYLKETLMPAAQPALQPTTPPGGIIFDSRFCSVWQQLRSQAPNEKIELDSGYYVLLLKLEGDKGQAADPAGEPPQDASKENVKGGSPSHRNKGDPLQNFHSYPDSSNRVTDTPYRVAGFWLF